MSGEPSQAPPDDEHMTIRVITEDRTEMHFRVRRTCPFYKLKRSVSKQVHVPAERLRFLYNSVDVSDNATPAELEMNDYDLIESRVESTVEQINETSV